MNNETAKGCCKERDESFGGGSTMIPRTRKCGNLDCPCHQDQSEKGTWRERLDLEWAKDWEPNLRLFVIQFISEVEQAAFSRGVEAGEKAAHEINNLCSIKP